MSPIETNLKRRCLEGTSGMALLAAGLALALSAATTAAAFTQPPNTIQSTLEGCRNGGTIQITPEGILPNADGNFVCQDPAPLNGNDTPYVTGNLGKGWNELDLVPHRLILKNGNSKGPITYNVLIAADYKTAGRIGYDLVTEPEILKSPDTLNLFSDASCQVSSGPQSVGGSVTGGADNVIYRVLTVTQGTDSTCVIDWANRLAVGAHEYPGSSLQSYIFEKEDFSTGKRTVSIPVKDILPQELKKDMSARQDTDYIWNATKTATPAAVNLGNTCDPANANSAPVKIRVEWKILPGIPGKMTAVTNIYATNPAARSVTVNVADTMFGNVGSGKQALDTASSGNVMVPANTANFKVFEHVFNPSVKTADLSDTATASYVDTATGIPVQGATQATASAPIQPGTQSNTTAMVTDEESISGNGVQYSADSVAAGSAEGNFAVAGAPYSIGTKLDKDSAGLLWTSATQNGNLSCTDPNGCPIGYVEFNKTVYVDPVPAVTSGTLSDTAKLTASDGFAAPPVSASVNISTSALVQLTIVKKLEDDILQGNDQACFTFHVTDAGGQSVWDPELCFNAGDPLEKEVSKDGLLPAVYTVTESPASGWTANPVAELQQQVDFANPLTCAKTVTFNNIYDPQNLVHAQVKKVSNPAGLEAGWTFNLQRCPKLNPAACAESDYTAVATLTTTGAEFELFGGSAAPLDLAEGTYRINEVTQPGWDTPAAANCKDFVVDYPSSAGATFSCTYTNTKLGKIVINKETEPAGGKGFGFAENIDAAGPFSLDDGGSKVFANVPAGNYTVAENDPAPNYELINLVCTDDADGMGWNVTDSSTDKVNRKAVISLDPGETVNCSFTNRKKGQIIVKKIIKGTAASTGFQFEATGDGYTGFTLQGGDQNSQTLSPGSYSVKELVGQLSWVLTGIGGSSDPTTPYNCTVEGNGGSMGVGDLNTQTISISLKSGDIVTCVFENTGSGATRTQGFWATHPQLAKIAWDGGSGFGHTFPGVSSKSLCSRPLTLNEVMGGFWSNISKTSDGKKRSALDQARMQLLQQLLAAELNSSAFGSTPSSGSIAQWQTAFCGTDTKKISTAQQQSASFNTQGDSGTFTPGTSADSKKAREIANIPFWNTMN